MKYVFLFAAVAAIALCSVTANHAGDKKFSAKCPVSGKAAVETSFVEHNGGKVYFCCDMCPKAFKADTAKFTAKANQQLVATKQATQKVCPLTGNELNADTATKVGDATVSFCCDMCKGKVENTPDAQKVNLLFNDKSFKKAFSVKK